MQERMAVSDFMLVAASNPCPCGFYPDRSRCHCSDREIRRYQNKISGPIRDRIDLNVIAEKVDITKLGSSENCMGSTWMREQVKTARQIQQKRFEGSRLRFNSDISAKEMGRYCFLEKEEMKYMEKMYKVMNLSARSYHKILKVARTIADLGNEERIRVEHLAEAVSYRPQEGETYVQ